MEKVQQIRKAKVKKKKKHEHRKQCKKRKEKNGGRKSQGKCILIAKEKTIVYNKGHSFSHFPSLFVFLIIIIMFVTFQFIFFLELMDRPAETVACSRGHN